MTYIRTECEYCERTRTLIKLQRPGWYECKACGLEQEIDTQPEEIT